MYTIYIYIILYVYSQVKVHLDTVSPPFSTHRIGQLYVILRTLRSFVRECILRAMSVCVCVCIEYLSRYIMNSCNLFKLKAAHFRRYRTTITILLKHTCHVEFVF